MTQKNACCVYDFTFFSEEDESSIIKTLREHCKKFSFQLERGEKTEKLHYQGRFSLKRKVRLNQIPFNLGHYSITSKENRDNDFYVTKEDTRVKGPWSDKDEVIYIPKQIREIKELREWQKQVIEKFNEWDTRHINIIVNASGNIGKSILKGYCRAHQLAMPLPPVNDHKEMLGIVIDLAKESNNNFIIDMPKSQKKDKLYGFYSAIESIKDGYAYDSRYKFRSKYFDCPNIWVFTNTYPDINLLSKDRWKVWQVYNNQLLDYEINFMDSESETDQ